MKKTLLLTFSVIVFSIFESCGDGGNEEQFSQRDSSQRRDCRTTTLGKDATDFKKKVKELDFALGDFRSCWEFVQVGQKQKCKWWGCYDIYYSRPDGAEPCSSGAAHEASLIKLASKPLVNFQAEICDGEISIAKITVSGTGNLPDYHVFDFELPAHFNPVRQEIWRDKEKKYKIIVRQ